MGFNSAFKGLNRCYNLSTSLKVFNVIVLCVFGYNALFSKADYPKFCLGLPEFG